MRAVPSLVVTLLLSTMAAVPGATAQTTTNLDGDWEGTWRCEAVDGAGAFTSPAIATISGNRIKLSRAGDTSDMVLNGTIDAGGAVTLTGRGAGPDGQQILSSFAGTVSGRALTASGRAVPLSGGAVQTCALALAAIGTPVGPTVLRGTGAPPTDAPYPQPDPYPPIYAYPSAIYWYDNDFYWRRHRLLRWEHWRRAREAALRRQQQAACQPGQMIASGPCRANPAAPPRSTSPVSTGSRGAVTPTVTPGAPQVLTPPPSAPPGTSSRTSTAPTPAPPAASQPPMSSARMAPAPGSGAPPGSFGRPAAPPPPPAQSATPPRATSFGPSACSPSSRGRC